jgi:hypothetical protein
VQGGHGLFRERPEQRQVQHLEVEVQHVELGSMGAHALEHRQVVGQRIGRMRVQARGARRARDQARRGAGIGGGEQGHLVPEAHQFFDQVENDPLGASVELRWHAFHKGGNLRDFHAVETPRKRHARNADCWQNPAKCRSKPSKRPTGATRASTT